MNLLEKLFFTKEGVYTKPLCHTELPDPEKHILTIEAYQESPDGAYPGIPDVEYHLYDNRSNPNLPSVHVVVTVYYETGTLGHMFRLATRPYSFKRDFSTVLKWDAEDVVYCIDMVEKSIAKYIENKFVFSARIHWQIQYWGLARELYRKCE